MDNITNNDVETTGLLQVDGAETLVSPIWVQAGHRGLIEKDYVSPHHVLPVALIAALAMSSTAATAYFTYATLLCEDPRHCKGNETSRFAKFIAATSFVSNILGMLALGPLAQISKVHAKLGLILWILVRSMSAVMLLLGVKCQSIYVALSGRFFEGLASDNLLHFTLNTVYTRSQEPGMTSSLIGYSLGLYVIGISISPFIAGLFHDFTVSFFMALGLFAFAAGYVQFCVGIGRRDIKNKTCDIIPDHGAHTITLGGRWMSSLKAFSAPLQNLVQLPTSLLCGLSLFVYNAVQSYTFSALLIHTSVRFGFTGRQNGFVIAIAHSIAGLYLLITLLVVPRVAKLVYKDSHPDIRSKEGPRPRDGILSMLSLGLQAVSFVIVGLATKSWHVYIATALLALGLPTPSFIKAYIIGLYPRPQRNDVLAALAALEVMGDVLGPVAFGGWQALSMTGQGVFFGAAGIVSISFILFGFGLCWVSSEGAHSACDASEYGENEGVGFQ